MSEVSKKIEKASAFYNTSFLSVDYQLAQFAYQTLKPFFKGSLALEIGPASGYMTKDLINDFGSLYVIEAAKVLLDEIPNYPNVTKVHSLIEDFDTQLKFDTIIMSHVLEHIAMPNVVLSKIYNLLSEDGVFLVAVPNAKSIHRMVAVQMGLLTSEYELNQRDNELGHYRVYDLDLLKEQMINSGFRIIKEGGYFLKPLTNSQIEKSWTKEMMDGFYKVGLRFPEISAEIFTVCKK